MSLTTVFDARCLDPVNSTTHFLHCLTSHGSAQTFDPGSETQEVERLTVSWLRRAEGDPQFSKIPARLQASTAVAMASKVVLDAHSAGISQLPHIKELTESVGIGAVLVAMQLTESEARSVLAGHFGGDDVRIECGKPIFFSKKTWIADSLRSGLLEACVPFFVECEAMLLNALGFNLGLTRVDPISVNP